MATWEALADTWAGLDGATWATIDEERIWSTTELEGRYTHRIELQGVLPAQEVALEGLLPNWVTLEGET